MIICFGLISKNINSQSAGDISFIAFNGDGNDEFAFVALANIPANTSIWFTDNEWDGDSFNNIHEGEIEWSHTSILPAGSIVVIQGNSGTLVSGLGSISGSGINLVVSNETLYALLSQPLDDRIVMPTTGFLAGISNDDSGSGGTLEGTGLTSGTNFIDFDDDYDGYKFTGSREGQASFSDYLPLIMNTTNWQIETSDGTLILPISTTSFTIGAATPGISLGAFSNNTNETGTTATFTAVLDTQPKDNIVLNISSGDTGEVTLDIAALTFTNADWDTPQTVTATGIDDLLQDGSIVVTITVAVNDASSDDDYDAVVNVTTTVTNEDDELPDLVINEFQADPDADDGDANGDGSVNTSEDEFIEIYNASGAEIDITNYTIEDNDGIKHTFPKGTILPTGAVIVVFGGGIPTGITSLAQVASAGALILNNGGDSITIKDASYTLVSTHTYGSEGGDDQSLARDTDLTGAFVKHTTIAGNAVLFSPGRKNADYIPFAKTWTGATNNDWSTATNWDSNSDPSTSTDNVWIPAGLTNYPTSTAAVTVNSITINSGATLKAEYAFTGSVTYNRNLSTTNWYLMSSPVSGETIENIIANHTLATNALNYGLAPYDNSEALAYDSWDYQVATSTGTLINGKGYSVKPDAIGDISFTGTLNATDVSILLTQGATMGGTNFNLLGNPYTTFINSGTFLTEEGITTSDITSATLWVWNQSLGASGAYETKVAVDSFKAAPGQGFFVEANSTNNVTFTEAMQSHEAADTFQRSSKTEVHLFINDGNDSKFLKVYYINGTTKGFDNGYDGELFRGDSHSLALYSQLVSDNQGENYQVQSLPNSDYENMVIPIGIDAAAGKEITLSAEVLNLPSDIKLFLEDRLTNTFTRLDEVNSVYKVTLTETLNGIGRFYIHTKSTMILSADEVNLENVSIYKTDNSNLRIVGLTQGASNLKVFNILGKQVMNISFTSNEVQDISLPNLASGIYIIQLATENGKLNKRITLK